MTPEVTIRSANMTDIDAVLQLWEYARSSAAATPDTPAGVAKLLEHAPDSLLVAQVDGQIVGSLIVGWDGWRGNMYRLAVLPPFRRNGIGRRLVNKANEQLRAKGAKRVTALVGTEDDVASSFWSAVDYPFDPHDVRHVRNL